MGDKIGEILASEKWSKESRVKKKLTRKELDKQKKEEMENERLANVRKFPGVNMEAFKIPAVETQEKHPNKRLGHTGPQPWADRQYRQGGNANPRRRRREYPSGHHNCG